MFAIIEMYEHSTQDKRYFSGILEGKSSTPACMRQLAWACMGNISGDGNLADSTEQLPPRQ